jgi:hypothetical protein
MDSSNMNWENITWSPTIGDPTLTGWIIVFAYFMTAAAALTLFLSQKLTESDRIYWLILSILLTFLGINKQLDLQTLFTQVGKEFVTSIGLYSYRLLIQLPIAIIFISVMILFGNKIARIPSSNPMIRAISTGGTILLLIFIAIRTLSMHHIDHLLSISLYNFALNQFLEFTAILFIFLGALLFYSSQKKHRN